MTTVAVRDRIIAFDSRITSDGILPDSIDKAWVSEKHEGIIAVCGSLATVNAAARFFDAQRKLPWDQPGQGLGLPDLDGSQILFAHKDGRVFIIEDKGWLETKAPYWAIGSGSQVASVAMYLGADAEDAVETAIVFDHNSGPPVRVLRLDDIPQRKTRARKTASKRR